MKEETEENEWWEGEESLQDRVLEHCGERIPQWLVWNSQKAQHGAATSTAELLELLEGEAPVWRELYYNLILPLSESVDDVLYGMPPEKLLYAAHQVLLCAYDDREQRSARFEAKYCRSLRPDENEAVARRRNFAAILLAYALAKDVDDLQLAAFTRNAEAWLAHWSTHHPFREEAMEAAKAFHGSHAARVEKEAQPPVQAPAAGSFRIAEGHKTNFAKIVNVMYELRMFETDGGLVADSKQKLMDELGALLGADFKKVFQLLGSGKQSKKPLEIFDKLKDKAEQIYNK